MEKREDSNSLGDSFAGYSESQAGGPASFIARPHLLLHPTLPRPLHGQNPRTILGQKWWDTERRIVYSKSGYRCQACGVHKNNARIKQHLEAHECYHIDYIDGIVTLDEIVALCHLCHNSIHTERLKALFDSKNISKWFYDEVLLHRRTILANAGIDDVRPSPPDEKAPWQNWCLILHDGVPHFSKFVSESHWERHYKIVNDKAASRKLQR